MKKSAGPTDRYAVIMAGGRGERFWPLSRENRPKQLLQLLGPESLLQSAVNRVRSLVPVENILVITNASQAAAVRAQLRGLPRENVVAEPVGRDTCAAVTLGAAVVGARSTTAVMALLPADHVVGPERVFQRALSDCYDVAARGQAIVTIGIPPTEPSTAYGYIQVGPPLPKPPGGKPLQTTFYKAERFVEKPPVETAESYLRAGCYRWNAGMFIWGFVTITEALRTHQPEMYDACQRWFTVARQPAKLARALARDYPGMRRVSIDYALMERAHNVVVADGRFDWDDLGSWNALARHWRPDAEGNCSQGEFIHVDAARNIIVDARTTRRTPVAAVGQRDTILVLTDDAVLLAPRSQAQKIRELVRKLAADPRLKRLT